MDRNSKSRSRSAARSRRKNHILGELKATAVVIGAFFIFVFGYLMSCPAATVEPFPDYIGCEFVENLPSYESNEYEEVFKTMTGDDWDLLAKAVMCEAGHSNIECAEATVCVILNRVLSEKFPNSVSAVLNQRGQFTTKKKFAKAVPNALVYAALENVQNHGAKVIKDRLAEQGWDFDPRDYVFFSVGKSKYAQDFLFTGNSKRGQHHWIGRAK